MAYVAVMEAVKKADQELETAKRAVAILREKQAKKPKRKTKAA